MPGHSADVAIGYTAKVKGADDVEDLAASMSSVDKAKRGAGTVDITARVRGGDDVEDLGENLADLPRRSSVDVAAKVTGADKVDDLATDLDDLPATASSRLTAIIAGADALHDLASDVDQLSGTASSKVAVTVTGADQVDDLATDVAALPASTNVSVSVDADTKGVTDVRDRLGEVRDNAQQAHDDTAGFASEITGTLGGQFSEGAGIVSDFGEQFRNLRDRISEADDKRAALGKAVVGIGGTLLAGFGIDAILGIFSQINEASAATEQNIKDLAASIVESGGLIDSQFQKTQIQQIVADPGFQALIDAGADYNTVLDGLRGNTEALAKVHDELEGKAKASALAVKENYGSEEQAAAQYQQVQTLDDLATKFDAAGDSAIKSGRQLNDYYVKAGLAEDKVGDVANGVDIMGDALRDTGKDTDYATGRVKAFNATPLKDKKSTIDATDKASPKVDSANKKTLKDKKNKLDSDDKASPKVDAANKKPLDDKKSTLDANDYASGRVNAFNSKPISDKKATVDADTKPAQGKIDNLDGQTVKLKVDFDVQSLNTDYRVSRVTSSAPPPGLFAAPTDNASDLMDAAAPTSSPILTMPLTAGIIINFNGLVTDPAATARAIDRVVTRGTRRTTALRSGGIYGQQVAPV